MFAFVLSPMLVGLAVVLLHHIFFTRAKPRKLRLPPGPPSIPVLGHLHLLRPPLHRSLHELSLRYGPLLHVRLGSTPLVVVASAEMAGELFKKHEQTISDRPLSAAVRRFAYGTAGFAFAPYGPYWRFMRRLCMSELLGGRTVKQLYPVRRRELFTLLRTLLDKSQRREAVDVSWELIKLTNNVIMRMTASTTSWDTEEARKLVKEVAELVGQFNLSDFVGICRRMDLQGLNARIDDVHARFDAMMERILSEKEETRSRGDAGRLTII